MHARLKTRYLVHSAPVLHSSAVTRSGWIQLSRSANDCALIDPLTPDELELSLQIGANEDEKDAAANQSMPIHLDCFVFELVAGVYAPGVGASRTFEATCVVSVIEKIVAPRRVGAV